MINRGSHVQRILPFSPCSCLVCLALSLSRAIFRVARPVRKVSPPGFCEFNVETYKPLCAIYKNEEMRGGTAKNPHARELIAWPSGV